MLGIGHALRDYYWHLLGIMQHPELLKCGSIYKDSIRPADPHLCPSLLIAGGA